MPDYSKAKAAIAKANGSLGTGRLCNSKGVMCAVGVLLNEVNPRPYATWKRRTGLWGKSVPAKDIKALRQRFGLNLEALREVTYANDDKGGGQAGADAVVAKLTEWEGEGE